MFSCEFCKIYKNTFLQNTSGRLHLDVSKITSTNIYFNVTHVLYQNSAYILFLLRVNTFGVKIRSVFRSSRSEVFCKKCVLINFAKFTGKHLCQILFFNKVAGLRPETLLTKRLWHRCFPVNFAKFLRHLFSPLVAASLY